MLCKECVLQEEEEFAFRSYMEQKLKELKLLE